mgnify:CR=1 FL=1
MSKSDLQILNSAASEITQNHAIAHFTADAEADAKKELQDHIRHAEANQKRAEYDDNANSSDDDFLDDSNDPALRELHEKRLNAIKERVMKEKQLLVHGHGEYREIVEEDFLKQVCGSPDVVVHFYHREFFRCKIIDKHMRVLAPKYRGTKFIHIDAEKAPFFVGKLGIQMLPTVLVFKDGVKTDFFSGFDELGAKDTFRTEVLESWLARAGAFKRKRGQEFVQADCCDSDGECNDSDGDLDD